MGVRVRVRVKVRVRVRVKVRVRVRVKPALWERLSGMWAFQRKQVLLSDRVRVRVRQIKTKQEYKTR